MPLKFAYTHYLVSLLADLAAADARLATIDEVRLAELRPQALAAAARASAVLDGSPLEPDTAAAVDAGQWDRPMPEPDPTSVGGWAAALRLEGMATQDVAAVEYANLKAVHAAEEELAEQLFDDPLGTLTRLHGLICQGLVAPEVIGQPRRTEQAVHDGAQGMVIYNPAEPDAIPDLLAGFGTWLRSDAGPHSSAALPPAAVAAIVHERLLQWQPFEAGNGRVARAAARLVLRARGFNTHGLIVAEQRWTAAPGPYYAEVAATLRRRDDLSLWVERHTETLLAAAEESVASTCPNGQVRPGPRALAAAEGLSSGATITVNEYAQRWNVSAPTAAEDLRRLTVWGHLVREPRTLGRRFRRR